MMEGARNATTNRSLVYYHDVLSVSNKQGALCSD